MAHSLKLGQATSLVRKDGDDRDGDNFKGKPLNNETHASRTDADARLYRKGNTGSELRYMGHTLSDNRHGLIASAMVTNPDGNAEREASKAMINDPVQATNKSKAHITLGADKGTNETELIEALMGMKVITHVAQHTSGRHSAVPDEIYNTERYSMSQQKRKSDRAGSRLGQDHWQHASRDGTGTAKSP